MSRLILSALSTFYCCCRCSSFFSLSSSYSTFSTDLHIYNLDTVPPVHVVWNHVDTDKLTTANGGTFRRAQPVSVTNHELATESGWARRKRSAICSGKLCGGFIVFEKCCPCDFFPPKFVPARPLLSRNKRDQVKTVMQCAEWSKFAFQHFW